MHSFDYEAVITGDGEVVCLDCFVGNPEHDETVSPIFAESTWKSYPVCSYCLEEQTYVGLLNDGGTP